MIDSKIMYIAWSEEMNWAAAASQECYVNGKVQMNLWVSLCGLSVDERCILCGVCLNASILPKWNKQLKGEPKYDVNFMQINKWTVYVYIQEKYLTEGCFEDCEWHSDLMRLLRNKPKAHAIKGNTIWNRVLPHIVHARTTYWAIKASFSASSF